MLKVWRGKTTIFAECTKCGSYGTASHLQPKIRMEPEIEAAVERHTAHMMSLRASYTKAAEGIAAQIKAGSMARPDGVLKIRELWQNHVAQVRMGEASLPSPEGKVTEYITACPWCATIEEVELEQLPEDRSEPDFSLAAPVRDFLTANAGKGK